MQQTSLASMHSKLANNILSPNIMVPAKRPTLWTFLAVMRNQSLPTKRFTQPLYKADTPELRWFPQMMIYNMCWSLPFLNELWITGMREFLLRGIKTLHGNNLLIWEEAKMFLVAAIIHVRVRWKYQVFNLQPFIPPTPLGRFCPERRVRLMLTWKKEKKVWCTAMRNWNISDRNLHIPVIYSLSLHAEVKQIRPRCWDFFPPLYAQPQNTLTNGWNLSLLYGSCRHISKKPRYWELF